MENRFTIIRRLILGGALLGAFLVLVMPVFAYDKENTHPALTDEIVDFFSLSFSDKKITEEEKQWLIKGSIDEDTLERPLYHFYDPVYDRGIAGISSKDWATKDGVQAAYYNSQFTGFAAISGGDSASDFSYQRALDDYAKGDRKRAFVAFGHTLHLLEDAGVPDHTRNDVHPSFIHGQGSPYEHEMAKWGPENFNIARSLFLRREKPASLNSVESYFDKIADYSNSNFFSKDTISNKIYSKPNTKQLSRLFVNGELRLFIVSKDSNNQVFPLAIVAVREGKESKTDLISDEIGSYILDGYWERLSKEVVVSGAGALGLFLEEAENARQEYLAKAEQKKPSFWAQIAELFGFGDDEDGELTTSDAGSVSDVGDDELSTSTTRRVVNPQGAGDGDSGDRDGDKKVSPSLSPVLSPLPLVSPKVSPSPVVSPDSTNSPQASPTSSPVVSPTTQAEKVNINTANKEGLDTLHGIGPAKAQAIIDYRSINGQFQRIEDIINVSGIGQATFDGIKDQITVGDIVPTPTPVVTYSSGGGGGGGGGNQTPRPTPTPSPTPSPEPDGDTANSGDIIINEIAWMGSKIDGTANANAEWIELYNTTDKTIDLTGWTLAAQDGTPSITASGSIGSFDYYLLERTSDDSVPGIVADQIYTGALGNGGEHLVLKDVIGTTIDQVNGSNGWKLNGDDEVIGNNNTKETAQKAGIVWKTAESTPKAENKENTTTQNPSAVTNLAVAHNSPTVTATWSAPDPGAYSPASLSYDMRYSSTIFAEAASASWWSDAMQVASSSLPSVGQQGASQSASFDVGPRYDQTLYFGLKTKVINTCAMNDTACRSSGISNLASESWPSALDGGAWAMFGKDQYHTSLAIVAGPGTTATTSWTFDVAVELGSGYNISQPVVDGDGNVYFGAANGSSGKLVKLNKNGLKQWEYGTNVSIGTPAVLPDGTVYFGRIGAGDIWPFTAVSSNSSNKWNHAGVRTVQNVAVSSKGEPHFTYTSGSQKKLAVLNSDGTEKFDSLMNGNPSGTPIVLDNGTVITTGKAGGGSHLITAFSEDGTQLWQVSSLTSIDSSLADPSYDTATGKTYSAAGRTLFDIPSNPTDGSNPNSTVIASSSYAAATTVAITTDTLYVGFNNTNPASGSLFYALNKSNLTEKWSFEADGQLNKQLVIDSAGNAYFSTQNGKLYRVNATGTGSILVDSGLSSAISPVLTAHGLVWSYGSKVVVISD